MNETEIKLPDEAVRRLCVYLLPYYSLVDIAFKENKEEENAR